jgi:hypothetical protein
MFVWVMGYAEQFSRTVACAQTASNTASAAACCAPVSDQAKRVRGDAVLNVPIGNCAAGGIRVRGAGGVQAVIRRRVGGRHYEHVFAGLGHISSDLQHGQEPGRRLSRRRNRRNRVGRGRRDGVDAAATLLGHDFAVGLRVVGLQPLEVEGIGLNGQRR